MKKSVLLGALLLTILVVLVSACSNAATPVTTSEPTVGDNASSTDESSLPTSDNTAAVDDEGVKALIEERCSGCHNTNIIYDANYNESRWSSVIDQMIGKGAVLSDEEKAQIIEWLLAQP